MIVAQDSHCQLFKAILGRVVVCQSGPPPQCPAHPPPVARERPGECRLCLACGGYLPCPRVQAIAAVTSASLAMVAAILASGTRAVLPTAAHPSNSRNTHVLRWLTDHASRVVPESSLASVVVEPTRCAPSRCLWASGSLASGISSVFPVSAQSSTPGLDPGVYLIGG